jgi:hypothetical protein
MAFLRMACASRLSCESWSLPFRLDLNWFGRAPTALQIEFADQLYCQKPEFQSQGAPPNLALEILDEWRLCRTVPPFGDWLVRGAPSDDRLADRAREARDG